MKLARDSGADEDEKAFEEKLKRLTKVRSDKESRNDKDG